MARIRRQLSATGCYHIMLRGVNREPIFHDDADKIRMIECLYRYSQEMHMEINAYCLMSNHMHLLVCTEEDLAVFIKKIASSYVYYFNRKYHRIGHLFQDRFKSEAVETVDYFLTAARYIIRNPENAGICKTEQYPWSSWKEIEQYPWTNSRAGKGIIGITDLQRLIDTTGGIQELRDFILQDNDDMCMDLKGPLFLTDEEVIMEIRRITGVRDPKTIKEMPRKEQKAILAAIKNLGIPLKQLSRLTGVGLSLIRSAK